MVEDEARRENDTYEEIGTVPALPAAQVQWNHLMEEVHGKSDRCFPFVKNRNRM